MMIEKVGQNYADVRMKKIYSGEAEASLLSLAIFT